MNDPVWIAIKHGSIVGTPFGPDVPNGKYLLVEKLDSDGGKEPEVVSALCQYRDDLKRPPSADSLPRRIERIDTVIAAMVAASNQPEDKSAAEHNGEWMPIASAPKDRSILVAGGEYAYDDTTFGGNVPQREAAQVSWQDGGWCAGNSGGHDTYIWVVNPTHWMPLPPAPTEENRLTKLDMVGRR